MAATTSTLPKLRVPSQPFKRAQEGLYHGVKRITGNNVPHSKQRTRTFWLPNVQRKTFKSECLGDVRGNIQLRVTTKALKTIKKYNGLENYLLRTPASLLGDAGVRMRIIVREQLAAQGKLPYQIRQREAAKASTVTDSSSSSSSTPSS